MASSGSFSGSICSGHYILRVDWSQTQNVNDNTSTITADIYLVNDWRLSVSGHYGNSCTIDGVSQDYWTPSINGTGTYYFDTVTQTVTHDSDGSKTLTMNVMYAFAATISGTYYSSITASATITLDSIARASSVSANSVDMGSTSTIQISRASSAFTHTLQYSFGSDSGTIVTKTASTTVYWTPPENLASQIPNATSAYCTITCHTYNGNTWIGAKSCSMILSTPLSMIPSITSLTAARVDETVPSSWGIYVQSKSKATLTINGASGIYGSTIQSYSIWGCGNNGTSSTLTTSVLRTSGSNTFYATVTDSRGRTSAPAAVTINVVEYSPPRFISYRSQRCVDANQLADNGTNIQCTAAFEYSPCSSKNALTTGVFYKASSASEWINANTSFSSGTAFVIGNNSISGESSYDVKYTLTDAFGTITVIDTVSTTSVVMDFKAGGTGLAIGKVSEKDKFECAWDADFSGKLRVNSLSDIMVGDTPLSSLIGSSGGGSLERAYPIGAIYISTVSTNPADILGFGRWEQIRDRFLLAAGSYAAGSTGGEASHTLTANEMPSHSHGSGTLSAASATPSMTATLNHAAANYFRGYMMRDTGNTSASGEYAASGSSAAKGFALDTAMNITVSGGAHTHGMSGSTGSNGSGYAHNNMPPYLAVYVWKRVSDVAEPTYTVSNVSGSTYGFVVNSNGYYESQNKAVSNSYAICRIDFNCEGSTMYLDCINFAESSYDFGIVGNVDSSLEMSMNEDTSSLKNFKGQQSAGIQTVQVGTYPSGAHYLYVKYRKDSSVDQNNDSLQFKVRFE